MSGIIERIKKLKQEKNVAIVAHHYAPVEVHAVADVLSDSRGFFRAIMNEVRADNILIIAPTFFAEITAAMQPKKKVMVPIKSECPVAEHRDLGFEAVAQFKDQHPGIPLVCYGTSPLRTKMLADYIALPGEVVQTINSVDALEVLFVGEKNCADDAYLKSQKRVILYPKNPVCNVYNTANEIDVKQLKAQYPNACLMVHPECKPEVIALADHVMGTGEMHYLIKTRPGQDTYILGTELGFFQRMQQEFPEKTIVHLSPYLACNVFKVLRIETVLTALETGQHVVYADPAVAERVRVLFDKMLALPVREPAAAFA